MDLMYFQEQLSKNPEKDSGREEFLFNESIQFSNIDFAYDKEKKLLDELPDTHALRGPYLLPPGLIRTKWVLFNSKQHKKTGYLDTLTWNLTCIKALLNRSTKSCMCACAAKTKAIGKMIWNCAKEKTNTTPTEQKKTVSPGFANRENGFF